MKTTVLYNHVRVENRLMGISLGVVVNVDISMISIGFGSSVRSLSGGSAMTSERGSPGQEVSSSHRAGWAFHQRGCVFSSLALHPRMATSAGLFSRSIRFQEECQLQLSFLGQSLF